MNEEGCGLPLLGVLGREERSKGTQSHPYYVRLGSVSVGSKVAGIV